MVKPLYINTSKNPYFSLKTAETLISSGQLFFKSLALPRPVVPDFTHKKTALRGGNLLIRLLDGESESATSSPDKRLMDSV